MTAFEDVKRLLTELEKMSENDPCENRSSNREPSVNGQKVNSALKKFILGLINKILLKLYPIN